ncbi:unnamed protein product [Amoebophrya sp. A120]|nr:unnamed protein product [Amoebophrya sp. A120]|eukprot:GSA120T00018408001.1
MEEDQHSLVIIKIVGIIGTIVVAYAGIIASWCLQEYARTPEGNRLVKRANCLAGGVLLSVALVHVLPDAIGDIGLGAPILGGVSYILLFGLEIFVGGIIGLSNAASGKKATSREASVNDVETGGKSLESEPTIAATETATERRISAKLIASGEVVDLEVGGTAPISSLSPATAGKRAVAFERSKLATKQSEAQQALSDAKFCGEVGGQAINAEDCRDVSAEQLGIVKATLLFSALMVHSVLEGLGLGSAQKASLALSTMIAIVAHKGLAAFALGQTLLTVEVTQGGGKAATDGGSGSSSDEGAEGESEHGGDACVMTQVLGRSTFQQELTSENKNRIINHAASTPSKQDPGASLQVVKSPQVVAACGCGPGAESAGNLAGRCDLPDARVTLGSLLPSGVSSLLGPRISNLPVVRWATSPFGKRKKSASRPGTSSNSPAGKPLEAPLLTTQNELALEETQLIVQDATCNKARTRFLIFTQVFAFSTPLGAIIGMSLGDADGAAWPAVCSSLTAGTFLQIAVNELIPSALSIGSATPTESGTRLLALLIGFVSMSMLAVLGA